MDDTERLARIASELIVRVRDDDPEANGRWLAAQLPDPADWFRLAFALAALVPDDRTWTELTAWFNPQPLPRPAAVCGTQGGLSKHRRRRENPCTACKAVETERGRRRRAATGLQPAA